MKRICEHCGKPIRFDCFTNDNGDMYVHTECFIAYMNSTYGVGKWMELGNGEEDGCGGYYIHSRNVVGGYEGTGIYYTEYEREDLEDDE